jgi:ABC-type phosphate transport system substrate-binding protein
MMKRFAYSIAAALMALVPANTFAGSFKVVVNNAVHVDSLSKKEVSDLFMKRTPKWSSGTPVVPVDQSDRAAVRDEFSKTIHGKATAAVKSYWQQQIFSGRDVPPVEKASDSEVLALVRSNPGAIGYVDAAADTSGVRVLAVQ